MNTPNWWAFYLLCNSNHTHNYIVPTNWAANHYDIPVPASAKFVTKEILWMLPSGCVLYHLICLVLHMFDVWHSYYLLAEILMEINVLLSVGYCFMPRRHILMCTCWVSPVACHRAGTSSSPCDVRWDFQPLPTLYTYEIPPSCQDGSGCISLWLPRLPKLPNQCYSNSNGPDNLGSLSSRKEIQPDIINVVTKMLSVLKETFGRYPIYLVILDTLYKISLCVSHSESPCSPYPLDLLKTLGKQLSSCSAPMQDALPYILAISWPPSHALSK